MGFLSRVDTFLRTKESIFRESQLDEKRWGNEDLDPTPYVIFQLRRMLLTLYRPPARTWGYWNYFAFFWAVSFNPVAWNTGSSLVSLGLVCTVLTRNISSSW